MFPNHFIAFMLSRNVFPYFKAICNRWLMISSCRSKMTTTNIFEEPPCTDIVWMDLEMSGLDVETDKILEISCLITDKDLNLKSEGPCIAIKHSKEVFENMDDWCQKHHNESGLVGNCLKSEINQKCAEATVLKYLSKHIPKGKCPLAGNSVYMDRLFLRKYMPSVDDYMHYRIIDVSTIKELALRWNPLVFNRAPRKKLAHRSLDDIRDSLEELKYYRERFFKGL